MDILSIFSAIPAVAVILLFIVLGIVILEVVVLLKKKGKKAPAIAAIPTPASSGSSSTTPMENFAVTGINPQVANDTGGTPPTPPPASPPGGPSSGPTGDTNKPADLPNTPPTPPPLAGSESGAPASPADKPPIPGSEPVIPPADSSTPTQDGLASPKPTGGGGPAEFSPTTSPQVEALAKGEPITAAGGTGDKGDGGGKKLKFGRKTAILGGITLLLLIAVPTTIFVVQQNTELRSRAETTGDITKPFIITASMIRACADNCDSTSTACQWYVIRYTCDSNNLPGGCQEGGQQVMLGDARNPKKTSINFDQSRQCGTQQMDFGCRDDSGNLPTGGLQFKSYIGPTSCTTAPPPGGGTQPPPPPPAPTPTPPPPVSAINKHSTEICLGDNSLQIDYSIVVRNTDATDVVYSRVGDEVDAKLTAANFSNFSDQPSNLLADDTHRILWDTDFTLAPGETRTLTYRAVVPPAILSQGGNITNRAFTTTKITPTQTAQHRYDSSSVNVDTQTCTTPPPPPTNPVCTAIKVYVFGGDPDAPNAWRSLLSPAQLPTLSAGDKVWITSVGSAGTSGTFDRARFRINGGAWQESSVVNPFGEYYIEFTIPAGVTNFTFETELHHATLNQWF